MDLDQEKSRFRDVEDDFFWRLVQSTYLNTLLTTERLFNLYHATEYLVKNKIAGDFVECGVFLGGAVQLMASKLIQLGDVSRKIWLYDTFTGFTEMQSEHDVNFNGKKIGEQQFVNFRELANGNVAQSGYPMDLVNLVEGDVCETLPHNESEQIALLRLDTDTYNSTVAELELLYPKLVVGGVLILDDYGYSLGVRKAVDEYFAGRNETLFYQRPDKSSRTALKMAG